MSKVATLGDLRRELEGLPDDMPLVVLVGTYTTVGASAWCVPWGVSVVYGPKAAVHVTLPQGQYIGTRRKP